jgi:hypothetical protein
MKHYLNVGHCQFDLFMLGSHQQVIGRMINHDSSGCSILLEATGEVHSYSWSVVQHICLAP